MDQNVGPGLTLRQRTLGRHALGLEDGHYQSYRNRYAAGRDTAEYAEWMTMTKHGYAITGGKVAARIDLFLLTLEGAKLCLEKGETLDPEDFPE